MPSLIEPNLGARPIVSSTLPASGLSPEADSNDKLFSVVRPGEGTTTSEVQSEQPWHTLAAKYLAMGMSITETAQMCDCQPGRISVLLRNEWFQTRVQQFMEKTDTSILSLFKSASLAAFATLVEINNDVQAPKAVRVAAAKEILDRHLGKATQFMEVKPTENLSNAVEEEKRLREEIAREKSALGLPASAA